MTHVTRARPAGWAGLWAISGALASGLAFPAAGQCEWQTWPGQGLPGVDPSVLATTVWDPDGLGESPELLIVAGDIQVAGGDRVERVAAWDGTHWQSLGQLNGLVRALTVYDGALIAAGYFTAADGAPVGYIARWDGQTWQPLGDGMNNTVHALMRNSHRQVGWHELAANGDGHEQLLWGEVGRGAFFSRFPTLPQPLPAREGGNGVASLSLCHFVTLSRCHAAVRPMTL